ncbi:uncharacterized protein CEXT_89551 [Caerostris extrusa]|uniref:Gustatory receptor n=1 Tax=Caerostris extrusa TaxID=172846 RepID=A0AAV4MNQ7_CAEEX|nr:uncharacterized protein CEXT_89551 [Caerostris extrusa]
MYIAIIFRLGRSDGLSTRYTVDLACKIVTGFLMVYPLILYCSRLSESMCRIRETAACLIDQYQFDNFQGKRISFLLERIEKKDIIYLSACGMINLKRSFLLTAVGAIFTYGILIYSLINKIIA